MAKKINPENLKYGSLVQWKDNVTQDMMMGTICKVLKNSAIVTINGLEDKTVVRFTRLQLL